MSRRRSARVSKAGVQTRCRSRRAEHDLPRGADGLRRHCSCRSTARRSTEAIKDALKGKTLIVRGARCALGLAAAAVRLPCTKTG